MADTFYVKWLLILAAGVWATVMVVQVGTWSAVHAVPLQGRDIDITVPATKQWRAVHVLVEGCACSRAVAGYLRHRGPRPDWREEIWMLGGASADPVPGFTVTTPSPETVQAAGLVGGPRLLLFSPAGQLAWTGGYGPGKPREADAMLDVSVMLAVARGESPAAIPVFGCPRGNPYQIK